jgi:uncharacterized protein (DUF4415 family)
MTKAPKEFVAGRGYSKEDWVAADSPELTDDELASMRPTREVLAPALFQALTKRGQGQRGPQKTPRKVAISIRLSPDVLEAFKSKGPKWQTMIDDALREAIKRAS